MRRQYVKFEELPLKTEFSYNGNKWVKQSTRTAFLPDYNRTFYMQRKTLCIVGVHSRIEA